MTQSFYASDIGCVRAHNEDSGLALPEKQLYAVADGMGGQAAGEVASSLLVEALKDDLLLCFLQSADPPQALLEDCFLFRYLFRFDFLFDSFRLADPDHFL